MPTKLKIWIALLTVYVFWGGTYLGIRYAVETGVVLYIWRRAAGDPAPCRGQWLRASVVGLLLLLGGNGLVSLAEQTVPSGIAALIVGSVPLWMTTIEALRPGGVRPNTFGILGLLIGFGGITLLVAPSLLGANPAASNPLGILTLLFAAFFWSLGSIYSRHARLPDSSLLSTAMEMLTGSLGLYLAGTLTGEWHLLVLAHVTTRSWISLLYLALFGSMAAFTAYAWLLRNAPVSLVATYAYVNPVIAIFVGSLFAQEILNVHVLFSALIIIGSVVLINASPRLKPQPPSAAADD
jgi:drug/metabolite transporter (DMT)-like permease